MFNYIKNDPEQCEFISIAPHADIPAGERLFFEIDNQPLVLFNVSGQFFCIADVCSHDNGPVGEGDLEGFEIICPRHGARFDLHDGRVLSFPAVQDIPAYPVRVIEGMVEVGLPI